MATHSSVLAWRIPGMGEPGGLPSLGSHRVGHDRSDLAAAAAASSKKMVVVELLSRVQLFATPLTLAHLDFLSSCCLLSHFSRVQLCVTP